MTWAELYHRTVCPGDLILITDGRRLKMRCLHCQHETVGVHIEDRVSVRRQPGNPEILRLNRHIQP